MTALLETRGVWQRFGGLVANSDVSISVGRGEIVGLIGPNGAGKSTMIDLVSGVQRADAGSIRLAGQELAGLKPEAIAARGLARSFQNPRLYPRMTVWENLVIAGTGGASETLAAAFLPGEARQRAEAETRRQAAEVLGYLELAQVRDTPAGELSGGQRKLVSLGRLMMRRPRLMLLDEPAAGVNKRLAGDLFERIAALNRAGTTFLIVEHEMELIMRYCHRIVVMHNGAVLAAGTPAEIRRDPLVIEAYLGGAAAR